MDNLITCVNRLNRVPRLFISIILMATHHHIRQTGSRQCQFSHITHQAQNTQGDFRPALGMLGRE